MCDKRKTKTENNLDNNNNKESDSVFEFKELNKELNRIKNAIQKRLKYLNKRQNISFDSNNDLEEVFSNEVKRIKCLVIKKLSESKDTEAVIANKPVVKSNDTKDSNLEPNQDLNYLFEQLDTKYFKKFLSQRGVRVSWSKRMTKNFGIIVASKDRKSIEIRLSEKLLKACPRRQLVETLREQMEKANKSILTSLIKTKQTKSKKRSIDDKSTKDENTSNQISETKSEESKHILE